MILCWQHERLAEDKGELLLISDRRLSVDLDRSADRWRRRIRGARVLSNIVDLERRRLDRPPAWWRHVTDEDRRALVDQLDALLSPLDAPNVVDFTTDATRRSPDED